MNEFWKKMNDNQKSILKPSRLIIGNDDNERWEMSWDTGKWKKIGEGARI